MFYAENDSIDKTDPNGLESAEISLYSAQVETQGRSPDPESLPGAHSLDTPGKQKAAGAIGMAILNPRAGAWGGGAALTFSVAGQLYSKGTVSLSTTVDDTENGIYTSVAGGAGGRILGPVAGKLGSIAGKLGKAVGTGSGAYTGAKVAGENEEDARASAMGATVGAIVPDPKGSEGAFAAFSRQFLKKGISKLTTWATKLLEPPQKHQCPGSRILQDRPC